MKLRLMLSRAALALCAVLIWQAFQPASFAATPEQIRERVGIYIWGNVQIGRAHV